MFSRGLFIVVNRPLFLYEIQNMVKYTGVRMYVSGVGKYKDCEHRAIKNLRISLR